MAQRSFQGPGSGRPGWQGEAALAEISFPEGRSQELSDRGHGESSWQHLLFFFFLFAAIF